MVDLVVHRHQLRGTLANLCRLLTRAPAAPKQAPMPIAAHA
jgi:acetyl-CoA carboxylase carboxyl transferase subunit beta